MREILGEVAGALIFVVAFFAIVAQMIGAV